jgi:hypothetical protein
MERRGEVERQVGQLASDGRERPISFLLTILISSLFPFHPSFEF